MYQTIENGQGLKKISMIAFWVLAVAKKMKKSLKLLMEKNIQILFAIPENSTKLWWIQDQKTKEWTYAGGHFNKKGTRIPLKAIRLKFT